MGSHARGPQELISKKHLEDTRHIVTRPPPPPLKNVQYYSYWEISTG